MNFYLKNLKIKNYKKFKENELNFNKNFNLIVGENATGKTTVLDAIATSLGGYLQGFNSIESKENHGIKSNDVHVNFNISQNGIEKKEYIPVGIIGSFSINENNIFIKRVKKNIKQGTILGKKENRDLFNLVKDIEERILENKDVVLPIFSYHGTGRLWEQHNGSHPKMDNLKRVDGYKSSLNAKSNYKNFMSWFEKLERYSFNIGEKNSLSETVKEVIGKTIKKLTDKDVKTVIYRENDLEIHYKEYKEIERVSLLSDGYRNIIGIVSDIAYRMAILNPNLEKNIIMTPGVVLIDEIDLHLHPKWQREIVGILRDLFPNVQFIVSSHSPFIIQSMHRDEIISLDLNDTISATGVEMSIEDIAENIMNVEVPQMSSRKQEMLVVADRYFDILDKFENNDISLEEKENLKKELDILLEPFEDNMAYVAFLRRKRILAESKVEDVHETNK